MADWASGKAAADAAAREAQAVAQRETMMNSERHYTNSFQTMNDRPQMTQNNSGLISTTLGHTQAHQVGPHNNNSGGMTQNQHHLNRPHATGSFRGQNNNV